MRKIRPHSSHFLKRRRFRAGMMHKQAEERQSDNLLKIKFRIAASGRESGWVLVPLEKGRKELLLHRTVRSTQECGYCRAQAREDERPYTQREEEQFLCAFRLRILHRNTEGVGFPSVA